jgi:hypothetical protein
MGADMRPADRYGHREGARNAAGLMAASAHDPYAANSSRIAALRNWSAAGVSREPLTRPMRFKVRRATGSHNPVETPAPTSQ